MRAYIREDDFGRFILIGEGGMIIANSYSPDELQTWAYVNGIIVVKENQSV